MEIGRFTWNCSIRPRATPCPAFSTGPRRRRRNAKPWRSEAEGSALARQKREPFRRATAPFVCEGEEQFVEVVENPQPLRQTVRRCRRASKEVVEETVCPVTRRGCFIEEIGASPSGNWLVTQRLSGQGEWGYDVFRTCPLAREAGVWEERGYMLDQPKFSADEARLAGGFGGRWLGGWWAHPEDDYEEAARGGLITFGFLFVHHLPGHRVERHELRMDLPKGWLPEDPEAETWYGARAIAPAGEGVRLTLPGGAAVEIEGPLPPVILLPTPHSAGGRLLTGTGQGVKPRRTNR
jgi:hypothetical protein